MTEVLFILTTIFVAYVIYVVVSEQKTTSNSEVHQTKAEKPVTAIKQPIPQAAPKKEKVVSPKPAVASNPVPAAQKEASATPVVAAVNVPPQDAGKKGLKDPKTGEVATTYSNYRFTKRWIKEALVAEGLLEKVYKNDELNAGIEANIKSALLKLEAIEKYRV
jgi:outer membrane biosynthesis protein TonB